MSEQKQDGHDAGQQEQEQQQEQKEEQKDAGEQPFYKKTWFIVVIVIVVLLVCGIAAYFLIFRKKGQEMDASMNAVAEEQRRIAAEAEQRRIEAEQRRRIEEEVNRRIAEQQEAEEERRREEREMRRHRAAKREQQRLNEAERKIAAAYKDEMKKIGVEMTPEERQELIEKRDGIINDVLVERMKRMNWSDEDIEQQFKQYNTDRSKEQNAIEIQRLQSRNDTDFNENLMDWEREARSKDVEKSLYETMIENDVRRLHAIAKIGQEIDEELSDDEE